MLWKSIVNFIKKLGEHVPPLTQISYSAGLTESGKPYIWGDETYNQTKFTFPPDVKIINIFCGYNATYIITENHNLYGWVN